MTDDEAQRLPLVGDDVAPVAVALEGDEDAAEGVISPSSVSGGIGSTGVGVVTQARVRLYLSFWRVLFVSLVAAVVLSSGILASVFLWLLPNLRGDAGAAQVRCTVASVSPFPCYSHQSGASGWRFTLGLISCVNASDGGDGAAVAPSSPSSGVWVCPVGSREVKGSSLDPSCWGSFQYTVGMPTVCFWDTRRQDSDSLLFMPPQTVQRPVSLIVALSLGLVVALAFVLPLSAILPAALRLRSIFRSKQT